MLPRNGCAFSYCGQFIGLLFGCLLFSGHSDWGVLHFRYIRRDAPEIALDIPDENARMQILSVVTRNLRVEGAVDLMKIATSTPGFVGADLASLTNKAGNLEIKRIMDVRKLSFQENR